MDSKKYIGMDVHQASISVAVRDATGKLVMECIIETKAATILEFIQGLQGSPTYTWAASTSDVRALQKGAPTATDRIASTWVSNSSFNIDINFLDGNSHSVAFYCLDWDARNRAERFDVIDLATGAVSAA